jgi:hypothetical protein
MNNRLTPRKEMRAIIVLTIIVAIAVTLLAYEYFWG